jgi:prepilin-type N-terminal cleavage/methylation domain-containing protein
MKAFNRSTLDSRGFTLVEVLLSMTILAIGILVMGGLLARSSRAAEAASAVSYQTSIMATEAARYDALPFDQLVAGTTCTTVTTAPLPHTRCVIITNVSAKLRQVNVRLTPANPLARADSVMFERSISGSPVNPLNTP